MKNSKLNAIFLKLIDRVQGGAQFWCPIIVRCVYGGASAVLANYGIKTTDSVGGD